MSKQMVNHIEPVFDELLQHIQQARAKLATLWRELPWTQFEGAKLSTLLRELPWTQFEGGKTLASGESFAPDAMPVFKYQLQLPDKKLIQAKLHEWMQQLPDLNAEQKNNP